MTATPSATITQFTIDPATGNLSPLSTPIGAGNAPKTVATDPFGGNAYAARLHQRCRVRLWQLQRGPLFLSQRALTLPGTARAGLPPIFPGRSSMSRCRPTTRFGSMICLFDRRRSLSHLHPCRTCISSPPTRPGRFSMWRTPRQRPLTCSASICRRGSLGPIAGGSVTQGSSQNWIAIDPSGRFAYSADPSRQCGLAIYHWYYRRSYPEFNLPTWRRGPVPPPGTRFCRHRANWKVPLCHQRVSGSDLCFHHRSFHRPAVAGAHRHDQ